MYYFYLGGVLLPITPQKVTWELKNQNSTTTTVDGLMRSIWKKAGLTTISFDFELPISQYPYATCDLKDPKYYLDNFTKYKSKKRAIEFVITHGNSDVTQKKKIGTQWLNGKYTVEDLSYEQDAENNSDMTCSITLQQYQPITATKLTIKKKKVKKKKKTGRSAGKNKKKLPCKYVVKKGDSIAKIAKKFYGSSAKKYRELIWKANKRQQGGTRKKMENPADIKKGMKIRIPKKG